MRISSRLRVRSSVLSKVRNVNLMKNAVGIFIVGVRHPMKIMRVIHVIVVKVNAKVLRRSEVGDECFCVGYFRK